MPPYFQSPAPHIRRPGSVSTRQWIACLALLPLFLASVFFYRTEALRVWSLVLVTACAADWLLAKLLKNKCSLANGGTVYIAMLLACLLPPSLPSWMIVFGTFTAVVLGKELFGGLGSHPFHPAVVGYVFLLISFPIAMRQFTAPFSLEHAVHPLVMLKQGQWSQLPSHWELFTGNYASSLGTSCTVLICLSGLGLVLRRLTAWEAPLIYIIVCFLTAGYLGYDAWAFILGAQVFFAAFFLVSYAETTPLTRTGLRLSVMIAGLLTVLISRFSNYADGTGFAILLSHALTPWIDRFIRPRLSKKRQETDPTRLEEAL